MWVAIKKLGPIGSIVFTFIGYKQTERQRKVQIDLEYSNIQTNMGKENGGYMRNEDERYGKIEDMEEWRV